MFEPMHPENAIPGFVTSADLSEALEPLWRLFNVTSKHVFASSVVIDDDRVSFLVPAVESLADWERVRPPGRAATVDPQAGAGMFPTLMQRVEIKVLRNAGREVDA